ncbi:MAG: hypothetical protein L0Z55_05790 [Planctomycetes bacterium]|nr:hypothetical protein [Planctomycetota bacterium]
MTRLSPAFAKELPKMLQQAGAGVTRHVSRQVDFDSAAGVVRPLEEAFQEMTPGGVCCRAVFVRNVCGIGGLLFPAAAASALGGAPGAGVAANAEAALPITEPLERTISEIWKAFIQCWNAAAPPDLRLSTRPEEQSVEFYPTASAFPAAAGIFPEVLSLALKVDGSAFACALLLPIKALQGSAVKSFAPPKTFSRAVPSVEAAVTARAPRRPTGKTQPVVFLDFTGVVLPWLRRLAADRRLRCVMSDSLNPTVSAAEGEKPVAAVLAGLDLQILEQVAPCAFIEIHKREAH